MLLFLLPLKVHFGWCSAEDSTCSPGSCFSNVPLHVSSQSWVVLFGTFHKLRLNQMQFLFGRTFFISLTGICCSDRQLTFFLYCLVLGFEPPTLWGQCSKGDVVFILQPNILRTTVYVVYTRLMVTEGLISHFAFTSSSRLSGGTLSLNICKGLQVTGVKLCHDLQYQSNPPCMQVIRL